MTAERPADRTEELLQRLDGSTPSRDGVSWAEGLAEEDRAVLEAAASLRSLATAPIPDETIAAHLSAMSEALAAEPALTPGVSWASATPLTTWQRLRGRIAAVAATATLFTAGGGGAAVAVAQEANPGDALYGLKRASEQVRLVVSSDDAPIHLELAARRIAEAQAVPEEAEDLGDEALESLADAEAAGADPEAVNIASENALATITELLDEKLPDTASDNAREALTRVQEKLAARVEARRNGEKPTPPGQVGREDRPTPPGQEGREDGPGAPGQGNGEGNGQGRPDDAGPPGGS